MTDRFVYFTYIRTTPQKLFEALTSPEFTKAYWNETWQESEWKKGASWKIIRSNGELADTGEVLEIDPPRLLRVSWRNEFVPGLKEEGYSRCTYEIEQATDCVKLTVTHESDVEDSKLIKAVTGGWPAILASLKSLLETGEALEMTRRWSK